MIRVTWGPHACICLRHVVHSLRPQPYMNRASIFIRFFLAALVIGVLLLGYSYLFFQADDVRDFATITGILELAEEHVLQGRGGSAYLDIKLKESDLRYRVPVDGYLECFRRAAFFTEVPKGASIQLAALAADIAAPGAPMVDATPTVFVRGVRARGRDYSTVQDHIAWQKRNNEWKLVIMAMMLGASYCCARAGRRWHRRSVQRHVRSAVGGPPLT